MVNCNKKIKILLSAYACEPNKGSEPGVGWNWAIHLAEKYEVFVITRTNNKESIRQFLEKNKIDTLHFYYHDCSNIMKQLKKMPNGIFLYYKRWQKEIFSLAKNIVNEHDIDIIHHITFNEFRTPGKLYKINKPFVWGPIGGGQFYNPIFRKAYFSKIDIFKEYFRNFINFCYIHFSKDIHCTVKKASAILIADQSTEKIMPNVRKYYRLLETGYNLERNKIKNYSSKKLQKINLLWVGGIWPRKGLKLLIDALGESEFRSFELKIIGEGKDKEKCEKLINKYNLQNYIKFLGKLSYDEVNQFYDSSDLFIFTSLRDTSGNVVLEAMSHGLPVIALNHHGVGEIVTCETGDLIELSNYEQIKIELIESIKKYYFDNSLIEVKGKEGRKRLENIYTWKANMNYIDKVYKEILG